MMEIKLFFIFSIFSFTLFLLINGLKGPVCEKKTTYELEVKVPKHIPYKVKTFTWCMKPPSFRCVKSRTAYRTVYEKNKELVTKTISVCCDGYLNISNICKPSCTQSCIHGICAAPDSCDCQPGWAGTSCDSKCDGGKWGPKCENDCGCENNANCDHITGQCLCDSGFYGEDCSFFCNCPSEDYFCNATVGCICKYGYTGFNCSYRDPNSLELSLSKLNVAVSSSDLSIGLFCLIVVIIIALCVFVILRYKYKVNKLQNELNYVSYTESPQDRFENPVYSFSSPNTNAKVDSFHEKDSSCLNNDKNPFSVKNNIEKAKLQELQESDIFRGSNEDLLDSVCRSREFGDNSNPNIYHSIDDFKLFSDKEPIYDEIKPRLLPEPEMVREPEESFDNLEYDLPSPLIIPVSDSYLSDTESKSFIDS